MQEPPDRKAFSAARKITDKGKQLAALQVFTKDYPKSQSVGFAQSLILDDMLKVEPGNTKALEKQAGLLLKGSKKGPDRWQTEAGLARDFASAGTDGADLRQARRWAADAAGHLDEEKYSKQEQADYKRFKAPAPAPAALHSDFEQNRASVLSAVAQVDIAGKNWAGAERAAGDAYAADPHSARVCEQRGEIALHNGANVEALDDFERAELLGSLSDEDRAKLRELYRDGHGGSESGMEAALDAKYATLYAPLNYTPAKPAAISGGHTAMLELFTGSACPPCVGGDLAVEDLVEAYPRTELVALAFDQHIPEPDPLANTASLDRAKLYDVHSTPSYVLDGKFLRAGGWGRDGVEKVYEPLNEDVAKEAALPTAVQLKVTASRSADGLIHARAVVQVGEEARIAKEIAMPADAATPGKNAPATKPENAAGNVAGPKQTAPPPVPHLVVNFALVEDGVRYSGENGVRFHADVVRALAKPADGGDAVEAGKTSTVEASFDPAAVSEELSAYLQGYAKEKDIKFISTETALDPAHLAVAVWVQDAGTHRVLDAALISVEASPAAATAARGSR